MERDPRTAALPPTPDELMGGWYYRSAPYQAIVYLRRASQKSATNLGEIGVEPLPARSPLKQGSHIKFVHEERTELGRVDMIAPDDWDHTGVTPTIHVV